MLLVENLSLIKINLSIFRSLLGVLGEKFRDRLVVNPNTILCFRILEFFLD